ncbi:MAG: phage/plasmid primase, P4 family [Candidatus Parvarchaeota archaeon]
MIDITFLGVFPIGTGYRIALNEPTKSFEISVQDVEMYAKTGLLPSGLREKMNGLPGKLQGQILREIIKEFKKRNSSQGNELPEKFDTKSVAESVLGILKIRTFRDNETSVYYDKGVYLPNGETKIKEVIHSLLDGKESSQLCSEVIGKIQRATYVNREDFFNHIEHKLVLENGILDLDTLQLSAYDPNWLSLTKFPIVYNKDAKCDKILNFLNEVLRPEDIPIIQEWVGYQLWAFGYPSQKAMMLVGDGGNGKSVLISLIEALVGKNNRSAVSLQEFAEDKFSKADLFGKASNLYADLPDRDLKSVGIFKMLTGGDPIRAQEKHVKAFTFTNVAKLTFSCNKVPRVPEDTEGFFRRWIIIEFPYTFEGSTTEDKELKNKLTSDQTEMSGFLNWALEELQRLRANGWKFTHSKTVQEIREDYVVRSDPYKAFKMHCIIENTSGEVGKDELYQAYKDHCDRHKLTAKSSDSFFKNFKDLFQPGVLQEFRPKNKDANGNRPRKFVGILLREKEKWCTEVTEEEVEALIKKFDEGPDNNRGLKSGHSGQGGQQKIDDVQRVQGKEENKDGQSGHNSVHSVQGVQPFSPIIGQASEKNSLPEKNELPNTDNPQSPEDLKENQENEVPNDDFGVNYYRILTPFQYEFEKDGKIIRIVCEKGQVRKLSNKTAILYRPYVERACPNGSIWDPVSRECVTNMGDDRNG